MTDSFFFSEPTLDRCINAIVDQGQSVDDCLAGIPDQREAIEPLLRLTERLQSARQLSAPADFRAAALARFEQKLASTAQTLPAAALRPAAVEVPIASIPQRSNGSAHHTIPTARRPFMPRTTWALAAGLMLVLVLLLVNTTASMASRALPGDTLFQVKIAAEQIQLALAPSDAQDAGLAIQFTEMRFQELVSVIQSGRADQLQSAILNYQQQLNTSYTYTGSSQLTPQQKAQIAAQLADLLKLHDHKITAVLSALSANPPAFSAQVIDQIQSVSQDTLDTIHQIYTDLYQQNPNLPKPDIQFPYVTTPDMTWLTATPTPDATLQQLLTAMPKPGGTHQAEGPEWPTTWPSAWPTQWATEWATLMPTGYYTGVPPQVETVIATLWPTYIPTDIMGQLPTVLPTGFPTNWPKEPATVVPPSPPSNPGGDPPSWPPAGQSTPVPPPPPPSGGGPTGGGKPAWPPAP